MGMVIKFLGQPYPGREITVDDSKEEVKFGRGVDCDVGFPEDMAIVSRSHFALRKELGGYKFVINREKPVFLNGRPVYDDQDLPKSAEIQLSGPTGPKLRLERTDGGPSNQVKTEILKPQKDLVEVVRDTKTSGSRTFSLVLGVLALVVVLGGGGYLIAQNLGSDVAGVKTDVAGVKADLASIKTELPQIKQAVASAGSSTANFAAVIEKNKESVYLVSIQLPSGSRESMGTASVVLLPDGRKALATNSHVADLYNEILNDPKMRGSKLVVTQPKGPDYSTVEIISVKKHPGYDAFGEWAYNYAQKAQALSAQSMSFVPAYDVALLYVEDPNQLGEPLTYASRETMQAMKAGEQLAFIGYPSELLNGTSSMKPEPTSQTGIITSLTTFFLSRDTAEDDLLIQHSAPATGGASGSPMFNTKGEVVGFLNAGNIVMVKNGNGDTMRVPSSALVNYAQRADMLLDLAEGKTDGKMDAIRAQMAAAEAEMTKTPEVFEKDMVAYFGQFIGDQAAVTKTLDTDAEMKTPIEQLGNHNVAIFEVDLKDAGTYLFMTLSPDGRTVQALAAEPQPDGSAKMLKEGAGLAPYSFVVVGRDAPGKVLVVAVDLSAKDAASDTRPPGKVRLVVYRGVPKPEG